MLPLRIQNTHHQPVKIKFKYRLPHTSIFHLEAENGIGCCNKKSLAISTAKANVGRPWGIHRNVAYLSSFFIENCNSFSCEINIASMVYCHSVRAHFHKKPPIGKIAIFFYVIRSEERRVGKECR